MGSQRLTNNFSWYFKRRFQETCSGAFNTISVALSNDFSNEKDSDQDKITARHYRAPDYRQII